MEVEEACKICKAYTFYTLPPGERSDDGGYNDDENLVYRINVTLNKEGLVKIITVVLFFTVVLGIVFKTCRKQRENTTVRTRWVIELFFSILNIAWIASCFILLSKCASMLIYNDENVQEIVKLFPWYICLVLSCCIMDISESCAYRLLKMTNKKMMLIDPDDIEDKKMLKDIYMQETLIAPPSYDDAVKEPVVTATKITGPKITSPTRPEDERLNTTNTTHNIFSSSDLNNNNKDST